MITTLVITCFIILFYMGYWLFWLMNIISENLILEQYSVTLVSGEHVFHLIFSLLAGYVRSY